MKQTRQLRIYRPTCEALESRTVAAVAHASLIHVTLVQSIAPAAAVHAGAQATNPVALTELGPGATYQGQDGGLYGGGSNEPPQALVDAAMAAAAKIQPLNAAGKTAPNGRIGVLAIGQSTTRQWFSAFQAMARELRPRLIFVNAGQDGVVAQNWASQTQPWSTASSVVRASGLSKAQVQVLILDSARIHTWTDGNLERQIQAYRKNLARIVAIAKSNFRNLRLVYIMPFHFAGFAGVANATREPYAFQQAFGIRRLILGKTQGSPALLWGPYVFSNTTDPSYYYDGIHFTARGRRAMANLTWDFLNNDPAAQRWLWNV
jgi:hypothetical protein